MDSTPAVGRPAVRSGACRRADEALVLAFRDALSSTDGDLLIDYLADETMYQNMPLPAAYGRAAVHATLTGHFEVEGIEKIDTFHLASRDGVVFTERVDLLTALPTGKSFELPVMHLPHLGRQDHWTAGLLRPVQLRVCRRLHAIGG